jgi:hypothetical protein
MRMELCLVGRASYCPALARDPWVCVVPRHACDGRQRGCSFTPHPPPPAHPVSRLALALQVPVPTQVPLSSSAWVPPIFDNNTATGQSQPGLWLGAKAGGLWQWVMSAELLLWFCSL